ncbi:formylglycine-generating enzyme family protein [Kovacikia minuta CCNUW1]|nr:formylglycine-generating enzyme family protein [Kovacikia minuta CCNUW1]
MVIKRQQHRAQFYVEDLGDGVELEMVLLPGGSFLMGSAGDELERSTSEGPQHTVTVPTFCFGKYPVTQAQWQVIAALPQVNQALESDLSRFKGADRPVERVSWLEAVEFCDRLSDHTGRTYRLPSEAEWEYACRAGTTTPFHFGETITTDLANYDGTDSEDGKWSGSYGRGPKGIYRQETTNVGSFKVANAFGLYDMHGNVWEWCADHWHKNYGGAPIDGSAWLSDDQKASRLLRGGSWVNIPVTCRSAYRGYYLPGDRFDYVGFRIVCSTAKTRQKGSILPMVAAFM